MPLVSHRLRGIPSVPVQPPPLPSPCREPPPALAPKPHHTRTSCPHPKECLNMFNLDLIIGDLIPMCKLVHHVAWNVSKRAVDIQLKCLLVHSLIHSFNSYPAGLVRDMSTSIGSSFLALLPDLRSVTPVILLDLLLLLLETLSDALRVSSLG